MPQRNRAAGPRLALERVCPQASWKEPGLMVDAPTERAAPRPGAVAGRRSLRGSLAAWRWSRACSNVGQKSLTNRMQHVRARMIRSVNFVRLKIAAGLIGSAVGAVAAEPPSVKAKVGDPFLQCNAISNALPRSLKMLRSLGPVISQRTSSDVAEYCDSSKHKCRRIQIRMPGLGADLIENSSEHVLAPLEIEISSSKWRLMKGVQVGQTVGDLAAFYGVEAPPNDGEFKICGEVACLEVHHRKQRVEKLRLDCQWAW